MRWEKYRIGELCLPTEQVDPGKDPDKEFLYIDISSIDRDTKTISNCSKIKGEHAPSRARKRVQAGDIIISTVRPNLNTVAMITEEFSGEIASTGFCVLRPMAPILDGKFLFFLTITGDFISNLVSKMRGANYPAVGDDDVKNYQIPLPPLSEQRRIVEILDQADALRKMRKEANAKAERIIPALFLKMFGDPVTNPMGWKVVRFGDIASIQLGKMLSQESKQNENPVPYLRNANIQWRKIDLTSLYRMDFSEDELNKFDLRFGDLLVCEGGEVGRCALWRNELDRCSFQKALHRIRPHSDLATTEYLQELLYSLSKRGALSDSTIQLTIAHLTAISLKKLRIPLPPLEMQSQFSRQMGRIIQYLDGLGNSSMEKIFSSLLSRAFSGDLTTKWREVHMKELLAEMEMQAQALYENQKETGEHNAH